MASNEAKVTFLADTSRFRNEIKQASQSITQINAEIKLATATFNNGGNAIEAYSKKQQLLTQKLDDLKTKEQAIIGQLESAKSIFGENSTEVQRLTTQLTNNRTQQQNVEREIRATNNALQQEQEVLNQSRTALNQLNSEISEQENELNRLKRAYVNTVLEQGESSQEARDLRQQISSLNRELNDNRNTLNRAESSLQDFNNELEDSSDDAENAEKGWSVMGEVLADKVSDAIDTVIEGMKDLATESNDALTKLQAKTGSTSKDMSAFKDTMNEIYKTGVADSFDDISEALAEVQQQLGNVIDKSDFKQVTTNALNLSNVYDMDVKESVRAVNSMMKQFGVTSDEAYNLIVQGAQNGLNQNDDLLDTINEYSVQFASAGYSADDMFNMLKNGVDQGTWSVDKLGDAVKEMNIRFSDGTINDALMENRKQLGLTKSDVTNLQTEYNKGGESSKNAINKMIDAITSVDNKTEQYKLGVSVFGTMWEDLGADTIRSLTSTKGSIDSTKKSMDDVNNTVSGSLSQSFASLGNTLKQDLLQPLADGISPVIQSVIGWCEEHLPLIEPILVGIVAAVTVLVTVLGFKALLDGLTTAWIALNLAMEANPIVFIVSLIVGLIAAIVYLWNTNEDFKNALISIFGAIKDFIITVWEGIKSVSSTVWEGIKSIITSVLNGIESVITTVWNGIKSFITTVWEGIKSISSTVWNGIKSAISSIINGIKSVITTVFNAIKSFITTVWNGIKTVSSTVWNGIKTAISSIINGIKSAITTVFNGIKSVITTVFNGIKSVATSAWNNIKNTMITSITIAKNNITNVFNNIKSTISSVFNGIKSVTSNIWDNIKNKMILSITTAKDKIKTLIDTIKNFFSNLKLKLPNIKMPHLTIKGGFSIDPPKVPSFSVKWYAKGGIFTQPTILNTLNGLKGVGEAGYEAVLPIERLQEFVENSVNRTIGYSLQNVEVYLQALLNKDNNLYVDGQQLSNKLGQSTDHTYNNRLNLSKRGLSL